MGAGIKLTNEEFLKRLQDNNILYIPLEEYKNYTTKIKWLCYKNPKHIFEASPYTILNGHGCPYCCNQKVFVGENDMWTTNPEIANMLLNKNDGYLYTAASGKRVDWICPCCGSIVKNKTIYDVYGQGLKCHVCSDGISFGEKYVYNLLTQLKYDFHHDKPTEWSDKKRYDFYIPIINTIIETHGKQHYEETTLGYKTLEEIVENDIYKRQLALDNGIKYYIELDCRESVDDYIKCSIINSKLNELFDLTLVDWSECYGATMNSRVVDCAVLWNEGMKNTKQISEYTGINISLVISYLKKAAKHGLCDYIPYYHRMKSKDKNIESVCNLLNDGVKNIREISELSGISIRYVRNLIEYIKENNLYNNI